MTRKLSFYGMDGYHIYFIIRLYLHMASLSTVSEGSVRSMDTSGPSQDKILKLCRWEEAGENCQTLNPKIPIEDDSVYPEQYEITKGLFSNKIESPLSSDIGYRYDDDDDDDDKIHFDDDDTLENENTVLKPNNYLNFNPARSKNKYDISYYNSSINEFNGIKEQEASRNEASKDLNKSKIRNSVKETSTSHSNKEKEKEHKLQATSEKIKDYEDTPVYSSVSLKSGQSGRCKDGLRSVYTSILRIHVQDMIEEVPLCTCPQRTQRTQRTDTIKWSNRPDGLSFTWYHHERTDWQVQYKFCGRMKDTYGVDPPACTALMGNSRTSPAVVIQVKADRWLPSLHSYSCICPTPVHYLVSWSLITVLPQNYTAWFYYYVCERIQCKVSEPCLKHYVDSSATKAEGYRFPCSCPAGTLCPSAGSPSNQGRHAVAGSDDKGNFRVEYCGKIGTV